MNINEIKEKIQKSKGAKEQIENDLNNKLSLLETLKEKTSAIEDVQVIIQTTAKETQEKLRFHIEDIVNMALDTCFPGEYTFIVDFQIKRGKTEADMYLLKDDGETHINPMDASGGGVVDIISFALRLSAWTLSNTDQVIILDEPFKFLSMNLRPLAGEILKRLSEKLGLQIVMVTHDEEMINISDKVFEVKQRKGISKVIEKS